MSRGPTTIPKPVSTLVLRGFMAFGGVAGLALQVALGGSRSWVFRARIGGRRREMGLGGSPDVALSAAREARAKVKQGIDPIVEVTLPAWPKP